MQGSLRTGITIKDSNNLPINGIEARGINEFTYLITVITSLCMYVCDCTIYTGPLPPGHTSCADHPVQNLESCPGWRTVVYKLHLVQALPSMFTNWQILLVVR